MVGPTRFRLVETFACVFPTLMETQARLGSPFSLTLYPIHTLLCLYPASTFDASPPRNLPEVKHILVHSTSAVALTVMIVAYRSVLAKSERVRLGS